MKTSLLAYAGTFLTLLICDGIWLGLIARNFYRDQLGALMLPSPNLAVGALFYLFFAAAVVVLAVLPALSAGSIATAFLHGAILGLAAYGTYDITNLATLRNWPLAMSLVDMVWGTALTALTAAGGYLAVRFFG
ncbi:DUF2177 family protein [Rhizobium leguminosarum]|uniref:DUF2177 family protein n=1 Tax=Rhizobium leguminosarum bv. trifolii (strain WSM1325) TaxID=395491 RepID=C6ATE1_RHILS|nr:DUF2177 family protein [Rhizobium leguminosarum]ACS55417.1 conserved hypothetical protein [Rhizobium leguminosarum bv. trifolii WSM1325]MBY2909623.1 DUF2177 family protein [Rhizobium leguminosarum]MBY2913472.1 DUF2177 family protein [Rhizobium leguminosarum]MBY2922696.1 DUF2177 family protein [Rhizobium leguminosarum]MBY2932059.1 DUF2177 family protein [Rhizobium leguminosarum]